MFSEGKIDMETKGTRQYVCLHWTRCRDVVAHGRGDYKGCFRGADHAAVLVSKTHTWAAQCEFGCARGINLPHRAVPSLGLPGILPASGRVSPRLIGSNRVRN
jgi:hypothetical protein